MLEPASQLLLRNLDRLPAGNFLVINPPADELPRELAARADLHPVWFSQDRADTQALAARRVDVDFGAVPSGGDAFDGVLLFHPKERALASFLLFLARSRVAAGGSLWLVGENKGGIRGTEKRLAEAGVAVETVDSARHCRLVKVSPKSAGEPFNLEDWLEVVAIDAADETLAVASLPGVFSAGRLDEGTALLLGTVGNVRAGRVLDMGCGAGLIGAFLKKKNPALSIEMVDSNALAVVASEWTLRENGLDAKVYASDGFSAVSGTFDWIISNPPFHDGIATDYRFFERFIAEAPRFLRPGGRLRIVANAHLKYLPAIDRAFGNARTVTENPKFRVYEAVKN
ncbi:MAG: methyltransferase [Gammaproteobacteria bacterium]